MKKKLLVPYWLIFILILFIIGMLLNVFRLLDKREIYFSHLLQSEIPLSDNMDAECEWYEAVRVIAHAGGAVDGNIYTNSLEAIENSYNRGFRVVEVDLSLTKDEEIVLKHSWNDDMYDDFSEECIPTEREFLDTPIKYIYTPLALDEFIAYLERRRDLVVIGHLQNYDQEKLEIIAERIKELCSKNSIEMSKFWFMLRRPDEMGAEAYENLIEKFNQIVKVKWIYFAWENDELAYCLDNDIKIVMITSKSNIDINQFRENELAVYFYSTDDIRDGIKIIKSGCNGFFTNFLDEKTLENSIRNME